MTFAATYAILAETDYLGLFLGVIVVIALCVGGYFGITALRRYLKENDDIGATSNVGFGLSDLRDMLAEGQITQDEFDKAKHKMVASMQQKANEAAAAQTGPKHHPVPFLKEKR